MLIKLIKYSIPPGCGENTLAGFGLVINTSVGCIRIILRSGCTGRGDFS